MNDEDSRVTLGPDRTIETVESLLAATDAGESHGQHRIPSVGNWNAFLWLRRHAKHQGRQDVERDSLMQLVKIVNVFHGLSLARVLRLSLFDFRKKLEEAGVVSSDHKSEQKSPGKTCRLSVQLDPPVVTLDGKPYSILENAAFYLQVLIEASGHPRSGKNVTKWYGLFPADKVTRYRTSLPEPILKLVNSQPGMGSWLVEEAWIN